MMATIFITLIAGVESGVIAGVGLSLALYLWSASRPHAAIVGRVPETEHFRNVRRHKVFTDPRVLTIRSEEHTSELQSLMRISYAVFCLKKKKNIKDNTNKHKSPITLKRRNQSIQK